MVRFGICNELFEGWDFAHVCHTVADLGYEGLEIAPFTLAPTIGELSHARRVELRRVVEDSGLKVIGLHWLLAKTEGFHLTSPDGATRRKTADYLVRLAEATRELGGSLMVFGSPKQRNLMPGVTYAEAFGHAAEVFRAIMPALDANGVDLCLEPLAPTETNFLVSIDQANELIAQVDHPRIRLHLDVKAMSSDPGGTVTDLIRLHGPHAGHFHAQDTNLQGPGMGSVDFGPILKAVAESGYAGWVSVEVFDFAPGALEIASRSLTCLRRELDLALHRHG